MRLEAMSGENTAVKEGLSQGEVLDLEDDEPLGLFARPKTEEVARKQLVKRGPGRPPGARNKRII